MKQMYVRPVIVVCTMNFDTRAIICFTCDSCCSFDKLDVADHRIYPQVRVISKVSRISGKLY